MMLSSELRFKARQSLDVLVDGISDELDRRERLDQIEKSLFRGLLELGQSLLQQAVGEVADEEEASAPETLCVELQAGEQGVALQRLERKPRRLVTVFGELRIKGPVYALRRKEIEMGQPDFRHSLGNDASQVGNGHVSTSRHMQN